MTDRGSEKHSPRLDDELKAEVQPIIQGHGEAHVEEDLQVESMPDDTDAPETRAASGVYGDEVPAPDEVVAHDPDSGKPEDEPLYTTETGD